jgi:hypothetical protein
MQYGRGYHPEKSIITVTSDFLKEDLAKVPHSKEDNPDVQFFLKENPGYRQGHELACICEINRRNFKKRTLKIISATA